MCPEETPLLQVEELTVEFEASGGPLRAVDGFSLTVPAGGLTGLVGESGCGKSAAALAMMRLVPPPGQITAGRVLLRGDDLLALSGAEMERVRGRRLALVFQEPLSALNPVMRVGDQVAEVVRRHQGLARGPAWEAAVRLLERLSLPGPAERARAYPHQLSGGQRQRVMLAVALAGGPELIIADEPTTALDPTVQAQVVSLLREVCLATGEGVLFITHDLRLAAGCCQHLAVMRRGKIVEQGPTDQLLTEPAHEYTAELLALARGQ